MLKQRILTALILVPLVLAAIWYLPTAAVAVLVGALMLVCAWEWALFVPLSGAARATYVALLGGALLAMHPAFFGAALNAYVLAAALLWWGVACLWLKLYPAGFSGSCQPLLRMGIGWVAAAGCYQALWNLHAMEQGQWLVYVLLAVVWATDTGGYFAGKALGKTKLAVEISPNKTWEGLWGGVALAAALAVAAGVLVFEQAWWRFLLLGVSVALISVVGDLSISMFKRKTGVKDTGNLFPGHGGALDRLDSLLSAAPVLLMGLWLLERIQ